MNRELSERLKIISHCPIKVFAASYIPRYWYPYRLQHADGASSWAKDESLELIMDSAIGDSAVDNQTVLDRAHDLNADYVIPADVLHDQATVRACPECDAHSPRPRSHRHTDGTEPDYRCRSCGAEFDEPDSRPRRMPAPGVESDDGIPHGLDPAAKELLRGLRDE